MSRALIVLNSEHDRRTAASWCQAMAAGTRVEFKAAKRSLEQNALMWVLLTEVSRQVRHMGQHYTPDQWKVLFMHACGREVQFLPGLDGKTFLPWGQSTSDLSKDEMTNLIEFILFWGAEHGVQFSEPGSGEPSPPQPSEPVTSASGQEPQPLPDGVSNPAEEPVGAGAEGQEQSAPAPAPDEFTAEEWKWIRQGTRMLWAATEKGYQETVDNQARAIAADTPDEIGRAARDKLSAIRKQCKLVCFGEMEHATGRKLVAALAGVTEDELREVEP